MAAQTCSVDADGLIDFADFRAGSAPVRELATRDFALEVREELADGRNYSVWWLAQLAALENAGRLERAEADRVRVAIREALAALVDAYARIERAQALHEAAVRGTRASLQRAIDETEPRYPACHCQLHPAMTNDDLVALGAGCTSPMFCCPRLDAIRRRVL